MADLALGLVGTGNRADDVALSAARADFPAPKWSVAKRVFVPWASDIRARSLRFTGGSGPAWAIEVTAPPDSRWRRYSGLIVIDAWSGRVVGASVAGSNEG
jgi:hypothetical protein